MGQDEAPHSSDKKARARGFRRGHGRLGWLAIGGAGLALVAAFVGCTSSSGTTTGPGATLVPAYLIVTNSGSVPAILTIDLAPPVQTHAAIASCHSLPLQVPKGDSVKVVITDSTSATSATFEVPFYLAGVWAVDCAPNHGTPIALGSIGQVSVAC